MGTKANWFVCACVIVVGCQSANSGGQLDDVSGVRLILDAGPSTPVPPDGPASCTQGVCNYQTQDGCDAGAMCHPQLGADQHVSPTCHPAGTGSAGEPCAWLGCKAGYLCAADGRCRRMCCGGDWSVCGANESCTGAIELLAFGSSTPVPAGVGVCEPTDDCDVFDPSTCPLGQSCYIVDSRGGVGCLPSGTADAFQICSAAELCRSAMKCVAAGNGLGQCRRLCRAEPGGVPTCPAGEGMTCAHYVDDPPGVGECVAVGD